MTGSKSLIAPTAAKLSAMLNSAGDFAASLSFTAWLSAALLVLFLIALRYIFLQRGSLTQKARDDLSWQRDVNYWQERKAELELKCAEQSGALAALRAEIQQAEQSLRAAQRHCGLEEALPSAGDFADWLRARDSAEKTEAELAALEREQQPLFARAEQLKEQLNAHNAALHFAPPGADFPALVQAAEQEANRQARQRESLSQAETEEKKLQAQLARRQAQLAEAERYLTDLDSKAREEFSACLGGAPERALRRQDLNNLDELAMKESHAARLFAQLQEAQKKCAAQLQKLGLQEADSIVLSAALTEAKQNYGRLEEEYRTAISDKTTAEDTLRRLSGTDSLPLWQQERETIGLEMQKTIKDYARLHFGLALAEEAMARYREAHRGDMIEETERAFKELTNGAYLRLRTQKTGNSEALLAESKNGVLKRAEDMSKGTRFQLYMALRAASYRQLLDKNINLPFFCDDIFETFDEERTEAACWLMRHIGRQGQAVYFTHHRHVVEIAAKICGDEVRLHPIENN